MVAAAFVLMAAPALADCPVTDPACLPETAPDPVTAIADATTEVEATATSVVDQATAVVEQTAAAVEQTAAVVEQTAAAVEEAAAAATDQADQAVEPVTDTVKGILGQTPDPLDPGAIDDPTGALPDVLGSTVTQPSGPDATGPGGNGAGHGGTRSNGGGSAVGPSFLGRGPVIGPLPGQITSAPAVSTAIPQQGLFDRIGALATQGAKALAFPVALALIVLLFVAVQNRIDRRDPKLALAPIAPDLLRFE
jgi:hypothetical protein